MEQDANQDATEKASEDEAKDASKDEAKDASKDEAKDASKDEAQDANKVEAKDASKDVKKAAPNKYRFASSENPDLFADGPYPDDEAALEIAKLCVGVWRYPAVKVSRQQEDESWSDVAMVYSDRVESLT